jgi:hypothetical protein
MEVIEKFVNGHIFATFEIPPLLIEKEAKK